MHRTRPTAYYIERTIDLGRLPVLICVTFLASTGSSTSALAQTATSRHDNVISLGSLPAPPTIDGQIDNGEWLGAARLDLAVQIQPGDNTTASEPTEVLLAADAEFLFIAFRARDSDPAALRARVVRRDNVAQEDWVGVHLDTYDDRQRAYLFRFNPLGVQEDAIYSDTAAVDPSWNGVLESKGTVTADGYVVEVAIPFRTLRYRAGAGSHWGLIVQRRIARKAETTAWLPLSRDISGLLQQAGTLTGLDSVPSRSTISLIPTVTGAGVWARRPTVDGGTTLASAEDLQPALTGIYAVTPNMTVSGTLNPDFSQIEADVPQIDVNQRFALYYPEQRPFFLEGTEIFNPLSEDLVRVLDTRQVVDPDWGLKFTGKVGRQAIGILTTSDRAPGLRLDQDEPGFGRNAYLAVVRVQRSLLADSTLGGWLVDQRFGAARNTVLAADGRVRLSQAGQLLLTLSSTHTSDGQAARRSGFLTDIRFNHHGRHWRLYLGDRYVSPGHQNDAGFIERTDFHEQALDVGYEWRPAPDSRLSRWLVYAWPYVDTRYSRAASDGAPEVQYLDPAVKLQFQRNISVNCYPSFHREGYTGHVLRYTFGACEHSVEALKHVTFSGSAQLGEGVHYDLDNPVVGRQLLLSEEVTLKPNDAFSTGLLYLRTRVNQRATGTPLVDQQIVRSRSAWQLTRFHAARLIVDYDTAARQLGTSLLYAWTPGPNTAVYLGWNDQLVNDLDTATRRLASAWVRERRTVFLKLSYELRR